ncbi:hypothetical protein [Polaribacter cellanae]|uniref:hypothetical protein n=1 Tax=Polaribacter cellanae TaxID=2818493 RepID=UPI001FB7C644|nr:hypothetical protein [Polaribacter cellanae]
MNIYEEIRKDHDKQRELLNKLVKTSGDTKDCIKNQFFKSTFSLIQIQLYKVKIVENYREM